jgi:hypothetical protein
MVMYRDFITDIVANARNIPLPPSKGGIPFWKLDQKLHNNSFSNTLSNSLL